MLKGNGLKKRAVPQKKLPVEIDPSEWILDAKKKLKRAQSQFATKDYGDAISDLQGTEERIAKAIMLRIGMLPTDPKVESKVKIAFPGMKYRAPQALSHNWHERMLEDLSPFLDTMDPVGKLFKKRHGGEDTAEFWKKAIPDYRQHLAKARAVKAKPRPTLQELDGVLSDCNRILDSLEDRLSRLNIGKVNIPGPDILDSLVKSFLKSAGVSVKKEERLALENAELLKFKPFLENIDPEFKTAVKRSQILLTLAVLNVYLYQHHTRGSYPSSQYTESFPLVVRFNELSSLLQRILDLSSEDSRPLLP
jgi:hypothetical protein